MLVVVAALVAFEAGSLLYLKYASVDFVVARREASAPLYQVGSVVSWTQSTFGALSGWSPPESIGTWSVRSVAMLGVTLPQPPAEDLVFTAHAMALVDSRALPVRSVDVLANGTPVAHWVFTDDRLTERSARIPHGLVAGDGRLRVEFRFDGARSPFELGIGQDRRRISMLIARWKIEPA